jgi:fatty acid desaturase
MPHAPLDLPADLVRDLHRPRAAHGRRAAVFILLYVATATSVSIVALSHPRTPLIYLACAPLYLLAAASLHGISLFTHEAVHGTLSRDPKRNAVLGAICAWPVLQNFSAYRVLHLRHHSHLGEEGDPDHYNNYTRWTWLVFAMHWGRLLLGYPAYIVAIPILGFRHGTTRDRVWIVAEVLAVIAMVAGAVLSPIPRAVLIHAWLIPMVIINTLVNIRGMSQHTLLEEANDDIRGTRSILTSRIVAFFMCNENYHLEHHLYPGVPWYNLPALHRATKTELSRRGAPFIRSYSSFVWQFVLGSLRRSPMGPGR